MVREHYEPRGKMAELLSAMRRSDRQVWTDDECVALMGITKSQLPAYAKAAMDHHRLYRQVANGSASYSLRPFLPPAASQPAVAAGKWSAESQSLSPSPTPAPTPTPTPAPSPEPVASQAPAEPRPEAPSPRPRPRPPMFDAWYSGMTGSLRLHGLQIDADGVVTLNAEQVSALRRAIAWSPM